MTVSVTRMEDLPHKAADLVTKIREQKPRVHCLMNTVVQKFVADGLSAMGAIPSMTSSVEEVQAFVTKADALVVNLGTLDATRREVIQLALQSANSAEKPWVLDPAHCDYSPLRAAFAQELLTQGLAVLRANEAEYELLDVPENTVAVRTGQQDRISFSENQFVVTNGHPLMAKVTGTGCLSGALIAAFVAVGDDAFQAAAAAMLVIGVAAELATQDASGPGSFEVALLDRLAGISPDDVLKHARVKYEQG